VATMAQGPVDAKINNLKQDARSDFSGPSTYKTSAVATANTLPVRVTHDLQKSSEPTPPLLQIASPISAPAPRHETAGGPGPETRLIAPEKTAATPSIAPAQQPANRSVESGPINTAKPESQTFSDASFLTVDPESQAIQEQRTATQQQLNTPLNRSETPVMIGRQMAEAIRQLPGGPVELALNPEELGRVRLSIATSEAGIVVNVLAERPETLILMRRNIDQLAAEFHSLGYGQIDFSFDGGQSNENRDGSGDRQRSGHGPLNDVTTHGNVVPNASISLVQSDGLDLRL
ncbi:MAG: flagellar hook-length control protein FliK, partial [Sulfitobacter sp.]